MSRDEFIEKYGDVEVFFNSYYKYTFTYKGTLPDGKVITVGYGGDSSEIYRYSVAVGFPTLIKNINPYTGAVYEGHVELESFYDY